jgi:hypothetical protein
MCAACARPARRRGANAVPLDRRDVSIVADCVQRALSVERHQLDHAASFPHFPQAPPFSPFGSRATSLMMQIASPRPTC